jgi:hypothetical protein
MYEGGGDHDGILNSPGLTQNGRHSDAMIHVWRRLDVFSSLIAMPGRCRGNCSEHKADRGGRIRRTGFLYSLLMTSPPRGTLRQAAGLVAGQRVPSSGARPMRPGGVIGLWISGAQPVVQNHSWGQNPPAALGNNAETIGA